MGVSGFPIKAITTGLFDIDEPWFDTAVATYNAVFDSSGKAGFVVNNLFGFKVGQTINLTGTYVGTAIIKSIQDASNKILFTDKNFTSDGSGTVNVDGSIEWDVDTPKDILREIHIQFDVGDETTTDGVKIEVTSNDEASWMAINNGDVILGLQTFTMFVTKETLLNFRIASTIASPIPISCIVTSA